MNEFNTILDYIIDQYNKYDTKNLQFEQDILSSVHKNREKMVSRIMGCLTDITSQVSIEQMLQNSKKFTDMFYHDMTSLLLDKFKDYYDTAYKNTGDLIDLGNELVRKYDSGIHEMQYTRDKNTIDFLRDHAFEMMKGYNQELVSKMRAELGNLLLSKNTSKAVVRDRIERILNVNHSKAEEIAQTELSRAYNYGALDRFEEYNELNPDSKMQKYWYGFAYSRVTCTYCRPRIGTTYDINDDSECLPAHVRCRCVWLPYMAGWDQPISKSLISRANMLNTGYSNEMIYNRINSRLGIKYAENMNIDSATKYINGDRTPQIMKEIELARDKEVDTKRSSFNIASDMSSDKYSKDFNTQMKFWKDLCARAIVDGDNDLLNKSYDAIKAVMILPWSGEQLDKWNQLLTAISKH